MTPHATRGAFSNPTVQKTWENRQKSPLLMNPDPEPEETLPQNDDSVKDDLLARIKSCPVRQKDLAEYWKVSAVRVSQLVSKGMPLTSLADAEAWRVVHRSGNSNSGHTGVGIDEDGEIKIATSLEESLNHHRVLIARARKKWEIAQKKGVPEEQKLYQIYQAAQMAELKLKNAIDQEKINSGVLMKTQDALDACIKLLGEVVNGVDSLGDDVCRECNPDNPGLAKKVINAQVQKLKAKWSTLEDNLVDNFKKPNTSLPNQSDLDAEETEEENAP